MFSRYWNDATPSRRCEWVDQLRGWAVLVMIEVHVVNVFLKKGLIPDWLNFVNGLVAPSFIMCAGFSLALSTFRPGGGIRPFLPSAKRIGVILLCAYALHLPGFTLYEWTHTMTPQLLREAFKIDVLQCIGFSLLILHGLVRITRRPLLFGVIALLLAIGVAWVSPYLWRPDVADGFWLPIRGLINGNTDRGVTALFPLFPWFSFAALGAVLGVCYGQMRVMNTASQDNFSRSASVHPMAKKARFACLFGGGQGGHQTRFPGVIGDLGINQRVQAVAPEQMTRSRWSEVHWLLAMAMLGSLMAAWGSFQAPNWLKGICAESEMWRLHTTTLPSVVQRLGVVCMAGSLLGAMELARPRFPGINLIAMVSAESLLVYLLHIKLIFAVLLSGFVVTKTGWDWYTLGWAENIAITLAITAINLGAAFWWHRMQGHPQKRKRILFVLLAGFLAYFFLVRVKPRPIVHPECVRQR